MNSNNNVGNISGSNIGDNVAIGSSNINQTKIVNNDELTKIYSELQKEIDLISNESEKADANYFLNDLKNSVESKDENKSKYLFGKLRGILGDTSAIVTIGTFITSLFI